MAAEVFVAGVGMLKFGRYSDKDVPELGGEAALLALDDAGLTIRDVQMMAAGCLFQANAMVGQRLHLGRLADVGPHGEHVGACAAHGGRRAFERG